jgi:hypothetical protein
MASHQTARRRIAAGVGALALVAMATLSACGGDKTEAPSSTTTTTTSAETTPPSATPTEKGLEPGGGNKYTPTIKAPTPATAIPGDN